MTVNKKRLSVGGDIKYNLVKWSSRPFSINSAKKIFLKKIFDF